MSPWINYHHLYYFKTIAELESVSKAAHVLKLGQPTLSAQLKQFEDVLGLKLFEREHKRLILTEHGKIALEYAQTIFKMGKEMYEVLHDQTVLSKPKLQIGSLDSIPKQIILDLAKKAYDIANCHITFVEGNSDEMIRMLKAHTIDIFISNFLPPPDETKGLFHKSIHRNSVSVYGAKKFSKLRNGFPKSISGQPFILSTFDSKLRYSVEHWFLVNNISVDVIAESQDIALSKLLAIDNIGLLCAADHTIQRQVNEKMLMKIGSLDNVFEEIIIFTAQRNRINPVAAEIIKKI